MEPTERKEQRKIDSSSDQVYKDRAKEVDKMRSILHKHLDPLGVGNLSKFFEASLKAMKEYKCSEIESRDRLLEAKEKEKAIGFAKYCINAINLEVADDTLKNDYEKYQTLKQQSKT